jgi:hypothetical protein
VGDTPIATFPAAAPGPFADVAREQLRRPVAAAGAVHAAGETTAGETGGLLAAADVPVRCKVCGQVTSLEQHGVCLNRQCALVAQQAKPTPKQPSKPVATKPGDSKPKGVPGDRTRMELEKIIAQSCADIVASRASARAAATTQSAPPHPSGTSDTDVRAELEHLSLWELLARARESGINMSKVDSTMEESKPKAAVVSLLVEHETAAVPCLEPGVKCIDAAKRGDVAAVREAIATGADLQQVGEDGLTALHVAAAKGRLTALRVLIEAIKKRNPDNAAVDLDVRSAGSTLGGNIFAGATALLLAARWGNTPEVVELVQAGANVDYCQELQLPEVPSPIHMAASYGHAATVAVLLQAGADSSGLYYGMTPRQWAAHGRHLAVENVFSLHDGAA